jgi:thiol-disulfide isomerase/thioredoxin
MKSLYSILSFSLFISLIGVNYAFTSSKKTTLNSHKSNADTIDLSKYKDKILVINFWASWSKTSRTENKSLVRIYQKHKTNPNIEFISISLDTDESNWKIAMEEDGMVWKQHFCDFKKYESQYAKQFGVTSIPKLILINKNKSKSYPISCAELDIDLNAILK